MTKDATPAAEPAKVIDTNVSKTAPPGPVNSAPQADGSGSTPQVVAEQSLDGKGAEGDSPKPAEAGDGVQIPEGNQVEDLNVKPPKKVEDFVKQAGLDPSEVARALAENEGQLDPDMLKALIDTHGEGVADLVKTQLETYNEAMKSAQAKKDQLLYDQLEDMFKDVTQQSGAETWAELQPWAAENIEKQDRDELNALLSQGGLAAKLAIQELGTAFKESQSYVKPTERVEGDNLGNDAGYETGALDSSSYTAALDALLAKGHDYNTSPEIKKLQTRRQKGIKAGI